MRRAIPAILLSAAAFVVVWRYEPTHGTTVATGSPPAVSAPSGSSAGADPGGRTVLGSAETMRYGTVQVQVTFSGGQITDVQVVQAPSTSTTSRALPTLRTEALRAQSADIDTVSGATLTSEAYATSLQAAIDARGN